MKHRKCMIEKDFFAALAKCVDNFVENLRRAAASA
jgi:hypothetical protein